MNIGIDVTAVENGRGPGRYVAQVLAALSELDTQGNRFYLYSPYKVGENYPANFLKRYIPVKKYQPWLNYTLPRSVIDDDIDVMFFPANDHWLWPRVPTVVSVLDIAPVTSLRGFQRSWIDGLQLGLQIKSLDRVASRIITISEFSSRQISNATHIATEKICVIPCGVSDIFCPPKQDKARENSILYVGGFDCRKNLERLLDAYILLLAGGYAGRLILAGYGTSSGYDKLYYDMPALVQSKKLTGKVAVIENPTDDMIVQLYQAAAVFVFPSLIEGFGLPVVEAMACGCPVACSNAASLPEVGGEAVLYFDPYDVADIAKTMAHLVNDDQVRFELAGRGLKRAKQFRWEKSAEAIYEIIKAVC